MKLDQHGIARIDAPEQPLEILARRIVQSLARRAASVLDQQATIATVRGVARRTLDARVGRDPGEDELLDPPRAQQPLETRLVKRAHRGLVEDRVARSWRELVQDLVLTP